MSTDEILNNDSTTEKVEKVSKRSASYPALTVIEAYNFALRVYNKFSTAEVSRKEIGSAFGVNDVSISRDVAASASYGFFDKSLQKGEKDFKYKVTELFNDIYRPENEKQKKLSYITAFGKPKLFQELINKFDNSVIPEELPNTLIKHHGITDSASKEVAEIFLNAGKEAGVINDSRFLNYKVTFNAISKTQYVEVITEEDVKDENSQNNSSNNQVLTIEQFDYSQSKDVKVPIHLTKNKAACLIYPIDISDKDIKLLEHAINGILLRLNLEKEDSNTE